METDSRLKKTSLVVGIIAAMAGTTWGTWSFFRGQVVPWVPVAVESATGQRRIGVLFELNDGSYTKPTNGKGVTEIDPKFIGTEATALLAVDFRRIGPVVLRPVPGGSLIKVVLVEAPEEAK